MEEPASVERGLRQGWGGSTERGCEKRCLDGGSALRLTVTGPL